MFDTHRGGKGALLLSALLALLQCTSFTVASGRHVYRGRTRRLDSSTKAPKLKGKKSDKAVYHAHDEHHTIEKTQDGVYDHLLDCNGDGVHDHLDHHFTGDLSNCTVLEESISVLTVHDAEPTEGIAPLNETATIEVTPLEETTTAVEVEPANDIHYEVVPGTEFEPADGITPESYADPASDIEPTYEVSSTSLPDSSSKSSKNGDKKGDKSGKNKADKMPKGTKFDTTLEGLDGQILCRYRVEGNHARFLQQHAITSPKPAPVLRQPKPQTAQASVRRLQEMPSSNYVVPENGELGEPIYNMEAPTILETTEEGSTEEFLTAPIPVREDEEAELEPETGGPMNYPPPEPPADKKGTPSIINESGELAPADEGDEGRPIINFDVEEGGRLPEETQVLPEPKVPKAKKVDEEMLLDKNFTEGEIYFSDTLQDENSTYTYLVMECPKDFEAEENPDVVVLQPNDGSCEYSFAPADTSDVTHEASHPYNLFLTEVISKGYLNQVISRFEDAIHDYIVEQITNYCADDATRRDLLARVGNNRGRRLNTAFTAIDATPQDVAVSEECKGQNFEEDTACIAVDARSTVSYSSQTDYANFEQIELGIAAIVARGCADGSIVAKLDPEDTNVLGCEAVLLSSANGGLLGRESVGKANVESNSEQVRSGALSSVGISLVAAFIVGAVLIALLAARKRKEVIAREFVEMEEGDVKKDDLLGKYGLELNGDESTALSTSGPPQLVEFVDNDTSYDDQSESDIHGCGPFKDGGKYNPHGTHVHNCTSATCEICAANGRRLDPTFIGTYDMYTARQDGDQRCDDTVDL